MSILSFFRKSAPSAPFAGDDAARMKLYRKLRFQSFIAGTVGYSLYYVCRTSLNVVKKPILESGALDATQLGIIGSALLFAYAIGKFVNGFLSDHSNIKRFMAAGLCVSAVANLLVGVLGFAGGAGLAGNMTLFVAFAVMWGVNGWAQSMGAPPAIIALSRWYPLSKRGTYYGCFSASHNLGEFLSFLFVGAVVGIFGWQWGFVGSSVAGVLGVAVIVFLLHDTPESKGLPPIEVLTGEESPGQSHDHGSTSDLQRSVIRNPFVWVLALSSAFMYVSRYAVNGWGVLFLQEVKGYSLALATQVISVNALLGIVHSMAHKTGAAFADYGAHIIHGAANAMYLPKVIAFNAKDPEAKKRYGVIADEMKLGGANDDEKVGLLIEYLRGMNDALNIPHCIQHYGPDSYPTEQGFVPENVFLERLPEIAKNAIADACTGSNPRQPSQEEMEKLLKCCYYDTEVDF